LRVFSAVNRSTAIEKTVCFMGAILPSLLLLILSASASSLNLAAFAQTSDHLTQGQAGTQSDTPAEAKRLIAQAVEFTKTEKYDDAISLLEQALAIYRKSGNGETEPAAVVLNNLGVCYLKKGDSQRAEQFFAQSLAIREKILGPDHLMVATTLGNLAQAYQTRADFSRAEPLLSRALAIREKALGPDHQLVAAVLLNLGVCAEAKGNYAQAESIFNRALSICEKSFGPDRPEVAAVLYLLAQLDQTRGDYDRTGKYLQRALAIYEKSSSTEDLNVGVALNSLAAWNMDRGDNLRAEQLLLRARGINEKRPESPAFAETLSLLGRLNVEKGDFAAAQPLYERTLRINEKAFGGEHPAVAQALQQLGAAVEGKGDFVRAENLFNRALSIFEKTIGSQNAAFARTLLELAILYQARGDQERAESTYRRALTVYEKTVGPDAPPLSALFRNMATLYWSKDNYRYAQILLERALAIDEKTFGGEHPAVADTLYRMAVGYRAIGFYEKAEPLFTDAIAILQKTLGPEHPRTAAALMDFGQLYQEKGDYGHAELLYKQSFAIQEKRLGPEHPRLGSLLTRLAVLSEAQGQWSQALSLLTRAEAIRERNLSLILATGSENDKRLYLSTLTDATEMVLTLQLQRMPTNADALRLALTTVLRRKGRALDAATEEFAALRRRANVQDRALLDQLTAVRAQLGAIVFRSSALADRKQQDAEVTRLEDEAQKLEAEISSRSANYRETKAPVTIEAIQQSLPADAALIEFVSYETFNEKGRPLRELHDTNMPLEERLKNLKAKQYVESTWGRAHYAAYVMRHDGAPAFVDLGDAVAIFKAISSLRAALAEPESENAKEAARTLDELLMRPVRKLCGNSSQLLISPEVALNLVPFGALVDENQHYLVENYSISYLTSARDLLRMRSAAKPRQGPMIFADPLFDLSASPSRPTTTTGRANRPADIQIPATANLRASEPARRSVDLSAGKFNPLPGTSKEAQTLEALLPGARIMSGAAATEGALKRINAPRILHIATHGFFLPDNPNRNQRFSSGPGFGPDGTEPGGHLAVGGENPLLRSGLVLAGANQLNDGAGEDGVLTALEAAGLDLWGTKLVVLSACRTGVGDIQNGEGVYGLRRALVLAGAESELMSLWRVDDAATGELMTDYYRRLAAGEGRSEALRQVQLKMMRSPNRSHPYYWAGFIPIGDWRSLTATK
jgi:CHAT domain-containing protein/Tfp pilus assembly protein PilF